MRRSQGDQTDFVRVIQDQDVMLPLPVIVQLVKVGVISLRDCKVVQGVRRGDAVLNDRNVPY